MTNIAFRPHKAPLLRLAALISVLLIGGSMSLRYYHPADGSVDAVGRLAKAVGTYRLTSARLSGGFHYVRCDPDSSEDRLVRNLVCARSTQASWMSDAAFRRLAADMRAQSRNSPSAASLHAAGIWNLIWGHSDDAVAALREAVRLDSSNARALNDLAVALTVVAQQHDDPATLVDAFVAADSATRMDSTFAEARFTEAVLLEQLYLPAEAIAEWRRYLQLDSKSPWAGEARAHLSRLTPPPLSESESRQRIEAAATAADTTALRAGVAENPHDGRLLVQTKLAEWGAAMLTGDAAGARTALHVARVVASALRDSTNDPFLVDAVGVVDSTIARADSERVRALAAGHIALADGIQRSGAADFQAASERLGEAKRLLIRGHSPMAFTADLYAARAQLGKNDLDAALRGVTAIRDSAPAAYLALRSGAVQTAGLLYDIRSDYVHVVAAYDSAVAEGRSLREPETDIRVRAWLARTSHSLNGRQAGWRSLYVAFAATRRYPPNPSSLIAVFNSAMLATAAEAPRLSVRYANQAIQVARTLPQRVALAASYTLYAQQLAQMREWGFANAALDSALAGARASGEDTRGTLLSDAALVKGFIAMHESPAEAEGALHDVVAQYQAAQYERGLPTAYLYLAQARIATGRLDSARAAFDSAMAVTDRQRSTVMDYDERARFLDNVRATIDQIVTFRADHGDSVAAFEFFESTRSRVLVERLTSRAGAAVIPRPRDLTRELRRALPRGTVVLSYAVLPTEIIVWTISPTRFSMHRTPIASAALVRLVTQLQESIGGGSPEVAKSAAEDLAERLLPPGAIEPGDRVVVIPDQWLHHVPFAALRDRATGRFFVQDHEVTYAPSAALLVELLSHRRDSGLSKLTSRVLAIGNPAFDSTVFPLPNLPASAREARTVAAGYRNGFTLIGPEATDRALDSLAPTIDILHFAGHAIARADGPAMSHLVLASQAGSPGAVFSSDIARWNLSRLKLVILSGCSTANGRMSATEGSSSLARAFFAAGASSVVASLWSIDDEQTADFFDAFHARLGGAETVSATLAAVQRDWIARGKPIATWAAFQFFGGG